MQAVTPQRAARDHFANPDDKKLEAEYLMLAGVLSFQSCHFQIDWQLPVPKFNLRH